MLLFLPPYIVGCIAIILYLLNAIFIPSTVCIVGLLRYLLPFTFWRSITTRVIQNLITTWIKINNFIIKLTTKTKFEVLGFGNLQRTGKYFLICNHQSWIDILIIYKIFVGRIPTLAFFLKRQLLWTLPIISWTCWIIGFPFMRRYSKSYLKKHPEKKGKDIEITKRFCQRYEKYPVTVTSFLEATRFTQEKKHRQHSPYIHLLKPKAYSFAFVLSAMGNSLKDIINVTIIYPEQNISFWNFVCGKIKSIIVHYEIIPISENLRGDYSKDRVFRTKFQNWLNQLWQEKDKLIEKYTNK
jgi:1-acyl-sn-glycerol-3-phosphate acyltransferase